MKEPNQPLQPTRTYGPRGRSQTLAGRKTAFMKTSAILVFLFVVARLGASGYGYSVCTISVDHAPIYTTSDFTSANVAIRSSLLRDELFSRVEVFIVPDGISYSVIIGKTGPKSSLSEKEEKYIYDEVRRLLIEAHAQGTQSNQERANQAPDPTPPSGAGHL
jgi:hypothetical protein